jgi:hypothetical protein
MKFCSCFLFIVVFNFLSFCSDIVKTELTFLNLFKKSSSIWEKIVPLSIFGFCAINNFKKNSLFGLITNTQENQIINRKIKGIIFCEKIIPLIFCLLSIKNKITIEGSYSKEYFSPGLMLTYFFFIEHQIISFIANIYGRKIDLQRIQAINIMQQILLLNNNNQNKIYHTVAA